MNIQAAEALALRLMEKFDLLPVWQFRWDKAKKRFGQCSYKNRIIQLSGPITEINSPALVEDTIRHEIAHAKDAEERGRSDHSVHWKKWAITCGARPKRCYSTSDVETPEAPLYAYCPNCGTFASRYRKIKQNRIYSCGRCTGKFNPDYAVIPNIPLAQKKKIQAGKMNWHNLAQASKTASLLKQTDAGTLFFQRFKKLAGAVP
ncbi:MAG: SprT-like domain-containing protein [Balneolaceae bacterium]